MQHLLGIGRNNAYTSSSEKVYPLQMGTCFFVLLRIILLSLASVREHRSGMLVNSSSVDGIDAIPSCLLYSVSKYSLRNNILLSLPLLLQTIY